MPETLLVHMMIMVHILRLIIHPINRESLLLLSEGPEGHGSGMLCWTHQTLLPQYSWLLEKETLDSLLNSLLENYCCSMETGIPSSHMLWTAEICSPFEPAVLCGYAAEPALQGWKLSTNAGSYKQSPRLCSALASSWRTHYGSSEPL